MEPSPSLSLDSFGAAGQAGTAVKTSGSCSPALNGSNNQLTIVCAGLSPQKANEMIRLMNQILASQLNFNQISSQLGKIESQLLSISKPQNMDPLAKVSPAKRALLADGSALIAAAQALYQNWAQEVSDNAGYGNATLDRQEISRYKTRIEPGLISWRNKVIKEVPDSDFNYNYDFIRDYQELGGIVRDATTVLAAYQTKVLREAEEVRKNTENTRPYPTTP